MYTDRKQRRQRKKARKGIKILSFLAVFFVIPFTMMAILFGSFGFISTNVITDFLVALPDLENYSPQTMALTTKIYSSEGNLINILHDVENRELVTLDQIPQDLINAVIAIEDERFYLHDGVDIKAIGRAFINNMAAGGITEGASTITQQMVTNVYIPEDKTTITYDRKITEASLAYQIEDNYSKHEILEMYLNAIYFGEGAYGVQVASRTYFNKNVEELNLSEAATLAGLIQLPFNYSPYVDMEASLARRNTVLEKMLEQGYITRKEYDDTIGLPIITRATDEDGLDIFAPYFAEYVKQELIKEYGVEKVFGGGLRVYTTIDPEMQMAAENAINSILTDPDDPSAAIVAMDPKTGHIKAMVGGEDFEENKFNLAAQGRRQPGSTFKIFVLAAAIEEGFSPHMTFNPNGTIEIDVPGSTEPWEVENYMGSNFAASEMNLIDATVSSVNVVYAQLIMAVGPENVSRTANEMGIETYLEDYPAIGLGGLTIGVSPLEVCNAFSTIANYGHKNNPTAILKVTDKDGNILYEHEPENEEVISPINAYRIIEIMEETVRRGTGTRAQLEGIPVAGKTGTTDFGDNAWFTGFTPNLTASVWIGHPESNIRMGTLHGHRVQGGTIPTMIWHAFMEEATKELPAEEFIKPADDWINLRVIERNGRDYLASRSTPEEQVVVKQFRYGEEPTQFAHIAKEEEKEEEPEEHVVHEEPQDQGHVSTLPGVINLPWDQANHLLVHAGYSNIHYIYEPNADVPPNTVYRQEPAGGQQANTNQAVRVWVNP